MRVTATGPLQTIVDSLAADIRRDVAIDDRQIRWIVHSPHFGEPDAARLQSILERRVSERVIGPMHHSGPGGYLDPAARPDGAFLDITVREVAAAVRQILGPDQFDGHGGGSPSACTA